VFTGIVKERGRVTSFVDGRLVVESTLEPGIGDSVSVDGVCLTVVGADNGTLAFDVVDETLSRVKPFGDEANLEPAARAGDSLGGHYVQGHVDGVARVRAHERDGEGSRLWLDLSEELLRYCVEKGSLAVDGVSLTIADVDETGVAIALVPHTLEATTLGGLEPGGEVNVEVDVLAKYVERLAAPGGVRSGQ